MSLAQELAYSPRSGIAVLGYGISSTDGIQSVCALLKKEDFISQRNQELFRVLQDMYEKGMPLDGYLDIYLLCEELKRQKRASGLGEKHFPNQAQKSFLNPKLAHGAMEEAQPFSHLGGMLRHDFPLPSNVVSCKAVSGGSASSSSYSIRYYIFFNDTLLVGNCEERIGQKVLMDLKAFDASVHKLTTG